MIIDQDPGDEHRDPWPFYMGEPFDMPASDDLAIAWVGSVPTGDGWHTAVAEIDRSRGTAFVVYTDGRVEDISGALREPK